MTMKKTAILLFVLFVATINVKSQEKKETIKWMSIEEALTLQKENPKKIFVDVYTDWCGWCKKMDKSTFVNPEVVKSINANYYAVKLDAEMKEPVTFNGQKYVNTNPAGRRSTHQLAAKLLNNKLSYPSFVLLNEDLNTLTVLKGYLKPNQIIPILNYLGEDLHNKEVKWEDYLKEYNETHK